MRKICLVNSSLTTLITLLFASSCGSNEESIIPKNILKSDDTQRNFDLETERQQAVSALLELNTIALPVAGFAQFSKSTAPVVYVPEVTNKYVFFQIARCKAERLESKPFNSWSEVEGHCEVVSETHPQVPFYDLSAPSGHWGWIARACMAEGTDQPLICHHSILVTRNKILFENKNSPKIDKVIESIQKRRVIINSLTDAIQTQTLELAMAYQQCDAATWKKAENLIKRSIIANIVGYGSALFLKIYSKELLDSQDTSRSWREKFDNLWTKETNDQKAIVRTLLWLFTTEDDFFESCHEAQIIKFEANFILMKVKDQQFLLAEELDQLRKNGVELSNVVFQ